MPRNVPSRLDSVFLGVRAFFVTRARKWRGVFSGLEIFIKIHEAYDDAPRWSLSFARDTSQDSERIALYRTNAGNGRVAKKGSVRTEL